MSILQSLEKGKSCGLDGLSSEHLIYSGERLAILLSLLFNTCTIHGYMPSDMISTVLIPIIKDKSGDVTDKSNYRPIALSSIMSKVFEHLLLDHMESFLYTSDNQSVLKQNIQLINVSMFLKKLLIFIDLTTLQCL